jgi:hypothetical protein
MIFAMSGRNWSSGSGEEVENVCLFVCFIYGGTLQFLLRKSGLKDAHRFPSPLFLIPKQIYQLQHIIHLVRFFSNK